MNSDHPELHPPGLADHILVPWRIPDELNISFIHAIDGQNLALRIVRDGRSHAATGRSECHFDFHAGSAVILLDQATIVNEAKINNVDGDFRIVALAKLVPDIFL
jgi:hypothetical protein